MCMDWLILSLFIKNNYPINLFFIVENLNEVWFGTKQMSLKFISWLIQHFSLPHPCGKDISYSLSFYSSSYSFFQKNRSPFYLSPAKIPLALKYKIHCQIKTKSKKRIKKITKTKSDPLDEKVEKIMASKIIVRITVDTHNPTL